MTRFRQTLLVLLLTILSGATVAQNNTNSPYTRYGYGQLEDQGSGNSKAMGGIAYGLRDKYQTNFANPASYTAVDSLTFMFDGGISMQNTNFSDGTVKKNAKNSSFDYITMQFRLSKWGAMSIGLLPYSNVGYTMASYQENTEYPENSASTTYAGEGGLHQLYLGAGFKIFKNLSVGANISYLWGDITHTRSQSFPSNSTVMPLTTVTGMEITSYKLDFGAQYTHQFSKKHVATLGVVFSPGHDLNNDAYVQNQKGNSSTGYTTTQKDTILTMGIPMTLGAGVTYVYDDRLTVGADVMFQKWSSTTFMNNSDVFCNRAKIAVGAEYVPNLLGRSYLSHIKYRLGAYYSKPYYKIDGARAANEYGVTAGFGLPLPRSRSVLSISAQYVRMQGTESRFLNENTLRLCIGVTFNEQWFWKRKVQ
ncbi:hypothetical protein [Bacteroides intestinalis]|uniref:Outer membrane protein n=1 Tax=Bacteroides intestinalis TaxID=329854 RepID=A0A4Q5HIH8_9BACE|nr:hypothetical protein [Bacteroides intestinalis]KAA4694956.1 hypothetical protein F3B37_03935 [Bacteroides intestinalis]KAA4723627.1 hypothetical protein F3B35_01025 [Bacteroides intestinalis]RYT82663.1 hypothetical protein EAJ06_03430 [Bacteroides intestinalis]